MLLTLLAAQAAALDFRKNLENDRVASAPEKINLNVFTRIVFEASGDDVCGRHSRDLAETPEDKVGNLGFVTRRTFIDEWADARGLTNGERTILSGLCTQYDLGIIAAAGNLHRVDIRDDTGL